jgi:hypothetical protein
MHRRSCSRRRSCARPTCCTTAARHAAWRAHTEHYEPFFYPLDALDRWNLLYGRRGFLQYQCVVPPAVAEDATRELLGLVAASRGASFLAVLKRFGDAASPGLLSFPRAGVTLALDMALRGADTLELCERLDAVVAQAGGAVYPCKDARMSPAVSAGSSRRPRRSNGTSIRGSPPASGAA